MSERLFRAIGREDMIADPRFRTNTDRVRNAEECEAPIVEFIAARTLDENMAVFAAAEVTAAPVYDIDQFLADPHVIEREIVVDVPDAQTGRIDDAQHHPAPVRHARSAAPAGPEPRRAHRRDPGPTRHRAGALEELAREGVIGLGSAPNEPKTCRCGARCCSCR